METIGKFPKKLVAAMSGGVDSSVATAIYAGRGVEVIGVTLKFFDCSIVPGEGNSSCGIDDHRHVLNVCEKLGIPHYFLDEKSAFENLVLRKCWEEYRAGRTPNPCVFCNRHLKFGALLKYAQQIGADGIITGHYAKIANGAGDTDSLIFRGEDPQKDQSYFLSMVPREALVHSFMPLGSMRKSDVRKAARSFAFSNAEKKESQDACLAIKNGEHFADLLRKLFKESASQGNFMNEDGKIIGTHSGIHNFTIGQRRGFGKSFGNPVFVKSIDGNTAEVILTFDENKLFSKKLIAKDINWINKSFSERKTFRAEVQIRYKHSAAAATVVLSSNTDSAEVIFDETQRAVTPGQIAAFYDGNELIGGGIISLAG